MGECAVSHSDALPYQWRKSTRSQLGACVEVRFAGGEVQVRNSRDPGGPTLSFTADEWTAFLAGAVESEFDLPDG
jgi:hypothetical protein